MSHIEMNEPQIKKTSVNNERVIDPENKTAISLSESQSWIILPQGRVDQQLQTPHVKLLVVEWPQQIGVT